MDDKYRFIGVIGGLHLSLGVYGSVKEGVCSILERGRTKILFLADLEKLWRKGVDLDWNEQELFNLFSGASEKIPDLQTDCPSEASPA